MGSKGSSPSRFASSCLSNHNERSWSEISSVGAY
jgi:hypothetical protein